MLKQTDLIEHKALSVADTIGKNRKTIIAALVLVVLAGGVFAGYGNYRSQREHEASGKLFEAEEKLATLGNQNTGAKPETRGAEYLKRIEPALLQLDEVAKNYRGLPAAYEAAMKVGDAYFQGEAYDKAAEAYQRAAGSAPSRVMKLYAIYSEAYSKENAKDYQGAIKLLQEAVRLGEKALKPEVLTALARNFALAGDKTKALEHYNMVTTEFPNTAYAQVAESRKKVLQ